MAAEGVLVISLQFTKGNIPPQTFASGSVSFDVAGSNYIRNVQNIGTSKEAMLLGDVGTPGYVLLHNLDATNFVEVFPNATDAGLVKLLKGEWALFRLDAAAPYLKADTAACNVEIFALPL